MREFQAERHRMSKDRSYPANDELGSSNSSSSSVDSSPKTQAEYTSDEAAALSKAIVTHT